MPDRLDFADLPPPDVLWVAGKGAACIEPGRRVAAGTVLTDGNRPAVAPLAGQVGAMRDGVVPVLLDDDAEHAPPPASERCNIGGVGREDLDDWTARLARAAASADRHNSPDLIGQLHDARSTGRPVDAVLCHALEADPTLPVLAEWTRQHAEELRNGLRLLARLVGATTMVLAVPEREHGRLARHLRKGLSADPPRQSKLSATAGPAVDLPLERADAGREPLGLRVAAVLNAYPQADPTLLAWSLLSRKLPPGRSPVTSAGVLVLDAAAAVAVGRVAGGAAVVSRQPVAVRDHRRGVSVLARAWRGSRVGDVLRSLGLIAEGEPPPRVLAGDYLRDISIDPDAALDGGELVLHLPPDAADAPPPVSPCVRCGWCLDVCPTRVNPAGALDAAQRGDADLARRFGVDACIGCGLCDYICPSRLPLLAAIRSITRSRKEQPADVVVGHEQHES